MSGTPLVSVVMTVFNGGAWLPAAMASVLGQTLREIELVVIDDASSDGSAERVAAIADPRVRLLRNHVNLKQTASLNRGLAAARGRYVARMDADDVCEPERLARQASLMEAEPTIGIVGSAVRLIDERGAAGRVLAQPCGDAAIRFVSMARNPFHHPSVMLRRETLVRHGIAYDTAFAYNQDFDLWTRLLPLVRAANLPDALLRYRVHGANMSTTRVREMFEASVTFTARRIRDELPRLVASEQAVLSCYALFSGGAPSGLSIGSTEVRLGMRLFTRLLGAFVAERSGDPGLGEARRWAARLAARAFLRATPSPEIARLVVALCKEDIRAPGWLIGDAAALAWHRLRRLSGRFA